ncbi:MAG: DUF1593 domain-containing protein [Marinilabiliaceae bacterium]|nr:DUF1593 domain-containing protein [Marinilabiliaceae bacterium]
MKLNLLIPGCLLFILFQSCTYLLRANNIEKPRIVVLTDVSTWETDDSESLVRLLVHADMFEIEGIIYTTGWSLEETRDDFMQLIYDAIDAYEKDLPNLLMRSEQAGFNEDESKQTIGYWPSPDYLRNNTVFGSKKRGIDKIGADNTSDGSNFIIKLADEADPRPLWILVWGGGNTLAQSIWQVQNERTEEELKAFLKKVPTYAITDQDRSYKKGTPFHISSHQWMRKEFKDDLMFLWDDCAWKYQNGTGREKWNEYEEHIQGHGNLGKVYPKYKYGVEGDTPAFLYVMPNGLSDSNKPNQIGWGGYFEWGIGPDDTTYAYINHKGKVSDICTKYEEYFYPATFNNFAARMDWAANGKGNRNPIVIVYGDRGIDPIYAKGKHGESVIFDASKSCDPDNDGLSFNWWVLPEAGTYEQEIEIPDHKSGKITVNLPIDAAGKEIHIICEVTDNGEPNLTSYRRVIVSVH